MKRAFFVGWQGMAAFCIAFGTSVGVLQAWPNKLQWLILISGSVVAAVKGVDAYLQNGGTP